MKRFGFLMIFLLSLTVLSSYEFQSGLRMGISASIGTGKGFWDWTNGETQRLFYPVPAYTAIFQMDSKKGWALESGLTYTENTSGIRVEEEVYLYKQKALEVPLMFKIYLGEQDFKTFMKLGPSCTYLFSKSSFVSQETYLSLLAENNPDRKWQYGLKCGLGLEYKGERGHWLLDLQVNSFYSSPNYSRIDGGNGNIRFHRFELSLGYLF